MGEVFIPRRRGAGKKAGQYDIGEKVKLMYDGVLRDFIVVHQGLPSSLYDASCDGTWLMMEGLPFYANYNYGNSMFTACAQAYNAFDQSVQDIIMTVKIPYYDLHQVPTPAPVPQSVTVFFLSVFEVGGGNFGNWSPDGARLDYFKTSASTRRVAKDLSGGRARDYWLRSHADGQDAWFIVLESGDVGTTGDSSSNYVRPVIVIPKTILFDAKTNELLTK